MADGRGDNASERGFFVGTGAGGLAPGAGLGVPPEAQGIVHGQPPVGQGWGRGPIGHDPRRYRFDRTRALGQDPLRFRANKVDRLSPEQAGDALHHIHTIFGIQDEDEVRIDAFDKALWLAHTLNGASILQPGRGGLVVDQMEYDVNPILTYLGEDLRRFFRAYADDIADTNREVLKKYDPYDHEMVDVVGQIRQVAMERGLQKYPHLCHDSSDACVKISMEERAAVMASKRHVLDTASTAANEIRPRAGASRFGSVASEERE